MRFVKMHGLGNDYVYLDAVDKTPPCGLPGISVEVSRRHTGVGADGLIVIERGAAADFRMTMFNADGSQGQMCGNGIRCVGKYLYEHGHIDKTGVSVETLAGVKHLRLTVENGMVSSVRVDMGKPRFRPEELPVLAEGSPVVGLPILTSEGMLEFTCLSMGNPHAVTFVNTMPPVAVIGPQIECHPLFPERVNVHFVQVVSPGHLAMRVWERGSGETQACGTGACAALVAASLNGLSGRKATVSLAGGDLVVEWDEETGKVFMDGPAVLVFEGEWINK